MTTKRPLRYAIMCVPHCVWCVDKEEGGGVGGGVGRTGLKQCVEYGKGQWEMQQRQNQLALLPSGFPTQRESARARERSVNRMRSLYNSAPAELVCGVIILKNPLSSMPAAVRELPQHWQLSPRPTVTVERRGLGKAEGGISHVQESLFPLTLAENRYSLLSRPRPPFSLCVYPL